MKKPKSEFDIHSFHYWKLHISEWMQNLIKAHTQNNHTIYTHSILIQVKTVCLFTHYKKNIEKINKLHVLVNLLIQRFLNPGTQPKLQLHYPSDGSSECHQMN